MNRRHLRIILSAMLLLAGNVFAYQVELSTFFATSNSAAQLNTWSNVAARAELLSADYGAVYDATSDPETNATPPTTAQWKTIFNAIANNNNGEVGFARSQATRDPSLTNALAYSAITNLIASVFPAATKYGYGVARIMYYDNALTINGTNYNYNWTATEVQYMRDWLNNSGYTNVLLGYDARNNGTHAMCANTNCGFVLLEAQPYLWPEDNGSRQELLQWLWTNSATAGKLIIFQMPTSDQPWAYSQTNNFMSVRQLITWLGTNLMGFDFLRSSNVIFKPITYNTPMLQWSPEMTPDGSLYTNTIAGVTLSLIEQQALFEGRTGRSPTLADAYSMVRNPAPTVGPVANQTATSGVPTVPITFTVSSTAIPAATLAVTATSSSTELVPATNITISTWASTDLGSVGVTGSNTLGDVITMSASGADISGTADAGRFIYQPLAGDGAMVARVTSLQPINAWSKAGVMMRASTIAGSVNCFMHVSASNGVEFTWRQLNNGATSNKVVAGVSAPCWLQLVKTGTNFAGYYALDNAGSPGTWTQVGTNIGISTMSSNLLSGLAGTAHNNTTNCIAIFDNISGNSNRTVTITPAPGQAGITTVSLVVSDGYYTGTNTFTLAVPTPADTAPTIRNLPASVTLNENTATNVAFVIGDAQTPADSLLLTAYSSNQDLIPNASLVLNGITSNRTVTLTPAMNQSGTATISVVVSDGTLATTNNIALNVPSYVPPVISNLASGVTVNENGTNTVTFIINDAQIPAGSLQVSGYSANPALLPNTSLYFGGSGSNRTVSLVPVAYQTGTDTISLVVSDGVLYATNTFLATVSPPANFITAVASGDINDPATWGGVAPVKGDTNIWQTGTQSIDMSATNTATFYGKTFVIQSGGTFNPGVKTATLTLSNLVLAGGTISMQNNLGLIMNLNGQTFTLNSGTLQTGSSSTGTKTISFQSGSLAGSGTINVTGVNPYTNGNYVEFQSTIKTTNFTGTFYVNNNGVLKLPAISTTNASFGLNFSDTGTYLNSANVALTALTMNTTNFYPGVYAYTNFTPAQQVFLLNTSGILTVISVPPDPPVLAAIPDQTIFAGQTLLLTNAATDDTVPARSLTYSLIGAPTGMTINSTNGIITWRPTIAQSLLPDPFSAAEQVADNGSPSLSAAQPFNVYVLTPDAPSLTMPFMSHGVFALLVNGVSGPDYVLQATTNLNPPAIWLPVKTNLAATPPFTFTNTGLTNFSRRFYRVQLGP